MIRSITLYMEPHHPMEISVMPRIPFFMEGLNPL